MPDDLDIYRTASVLIREHGEDAALEVAQRADKFLQDGNLAASAVWRRGLRAVKEIQREKPEDGEAVN